MGYKGKHSAGGSASAPETEEKTPAGKILLIIAMVLLVLVILFSAAALVVNRYLNKLERVDADEIEIVAPEDAVDELDEDDPGLTEEEEEDEILPEDIYWDEIEALENDNLINILLVGQDTRVSGQRERSDCMIVVSINPDTGDVSLISFMRDLYVQMPEGYQDNRMNAAYAYGGFPYLYEVLEKNFGIVCSGGFEVNFSGFEAVIDAVGGVDVELTAREVSYLNNGTVEGMNHLNGAQALAYARLRKSDSDFNRTQRQRTVLLALFENIKDADLSTLLSLMDTLLPQMTTDMTDTQILSLVMKLAPMLSDMEPESYRIPVDGSYSNASIRGMAVLVPDLEMNRTYLQDTCLPYADTISDDD